MENLSARKVLSVGVYSVPPSKQIAHQRTPAAGSSGASPNRSKVTREEYLSQLNHDRELRETERERERILTEAHPLDDGSAAAMALGGTGGAGRKLLDEHISRAKESESYGGFMIGDYKDSSEAARSKRESQRKYFNQLTTDMVLSSEVVKKREESPPRRTTLRRPVSPPPPGEFHIGVDKRIDPYEKREFARQLYLQNEEDIRIKHEMKDPRADVWKGKHEFVIGKVTDDREGKAKKAQEMRAYYESVQNDLKTKNERKAREHQEYVNTSGLSGLNIGAGHNEQEDPVARKERQAEYRHKLEWQQRVAAETLRKEKEYDRAYLSQPFDPPYLENR
jgi:hypothetical protein